MSSKHKISCNKCDFSTEIRSYRPFYILEDGSKDYAMTPIGYEATKRIDGYEDEVYCTNCRQLTTLTYRYKPYKEPSNRFLKMIKEVFFILKTFRGRKMLKPFPSCPHCKRRDFLTPEDLCPQCGEGEIDTQVLWIS